MVIKETIVAGCAIFAMFFGAGNIVFPIILGQEFSTNWYSSIFGFCLTGVIVPLMGLISVVLLDADSNKFFSPLGKKLAFLLQLVIMLIEGPFGIVPRALTIGFGGINAITDKCPNWVFFLISCILLFFLTKSKSKIVPIIGKVLTPLKLSLLLILVIFGVYESYTFQGFGLTFSYHAFKDGIVAGYQTYDLPGAVYFASIVVGYFYTQHKNSLSKKELIKKGIFASCLSAFLLTIMYFAFSYISAHYSSELAGMPKEDMLPAVVGLALGDFSKYLFGGIMVVACLTTAVAALTVWSKFIDEQLEKYSISHQTIIIVSILITFVVSNIGFDGIVKNMEPVLIVLYPVLILLTIFNIYSSIKGMRKNGN